MAERVPGSAAPREKSTFAVTCSLLSQYLKEKKGGLHLQGLGVGGLGMAPASTGEVVFRPPTTMNLLSALDAPAEEPVKATAEPGASASVDLSLEEKPTSKEQPSLVAPSDQQNGENPRVEAIEEAQQLTIFYGGKVVVFDNFPAAKVKELLQMVNGGAHGVDKATTTSSSAAPQNLSDMPIARRNSLHRFLEKRKGRIIAKAPYQLDTSAAEASSKQANGDTSWLGLGQEVVTVKQEI